MTEQEEIDSPSSVLWFSYEVGAAEGGRPYLRTGIGDWSDVDPALVLQALHGIYWSVEDRIAKVVGEARKQRRTWEEIGSALGVTRQSAWERYSAGISED